MLFTKSLLPFLVVGNVLMTELEDAVPAVADVMGIDSKNYSLDVAKNDEARVSPVPGQSFVLEDNFYRIMWRKMEGCDRNNSYCSWVMSQKNTIFNSRSSWNNYLKQMEKCKSLNPTKCVIQLDVWTYMGDEACFKKNVFQINTIGESSYEWLADATLFGVKYLETNGKCRDIDLQVGWQGDVCSRPPLWSFNGKQLDSRERPEYAPFPMTECCHDYTGQIPYHSAYRWETMHPQMSVGMSEVKNPDCVFNIISGVSMYIRNYVLNGPGDHNPWE